MKPSHAYEEDLASIRTMMERSAKFISLSGLSGVLAGVYALLGATAAYLALQSNSADYVYTNARIPYSLLLQLLGIAVTVLALSLATGLWLSHRKATKDGVKLWNAASRQLMLNLAIPLVTGGLFILILLASGHYALAAPASLIFYGLALIQGSNNTVDEIRYLGYSEIVLGLIAAVFTGYGLIFWSIGFGVLHILYGGMMYNKYEK